MNLTLYFRLIVTVLFQRHVIDGKINKVFNEPPSYDNTLFYCPSVHAKDGFHVSLQIHNGNYCNSENGYRKLGHTWKEVEFGFPSEDEYLMKEYSETPEDVTRSVGKIPVSVLEEIFAKHGGIDWEKTINVEVYKNFTEKR